MLLKKKSILAGMMAAAGAVGFAAPVVAQDEKLLMVTSTFPMTSPTPYAESNAQMYSVWCQTYGCLGRYNYAEKEYQGILVDDWEVVDPNTWRFHLREDLVRHDGGSGPTTKDVLHSYDRVMNDPDSIQKNIFSEVETIRAIDDHTFEIVTKEPLASLLSYIFDRFIITSAELADAHENPDEEAAHGWGPYKLKSYMLDQEIALEKNADFPGTSESAPDTAVYRQIREAEQRVTALMNGEVQIARLIPPQLVSRLEGNDSVKLVESPSIEQMFLAFNPKFEPWTDVRVRQAAAHAINKDLIIDRFLMGLADRLDGPLGEQQICYTGPLDYIIDYDPEESRRLLAEAGYEDGGPEIEFMTASGRYISDRQVSEIVTQMLTEVGFQVDLQVPEYANLTAAMRNGELPMYYLGRGLFLDPSEPLSQYLETDVTQRIGYSNPELDALLQKERQTLDPDERCQVVREAAELIAEEVPMFFMWSHRLVHGVQKGIDWEASADGEVWLADVEM
ncbi:ABC transporter substrate-binding protein [Tranquillimonas alkanivorans]|uniref:Peptide/nickel transport system substrate-binding protein n=1 Tax=Tranquillimonas alkanivorans TaxID=441119 RepID=A0A1I5U761_9RHOB|nr:ABC transporter substrate-binding protein [Tranquillimonas alkanivorans]SFP91129.1 peptide/nickel transport system substrate-binding protein [Tranquillimonas alkanivorans]